MYVTYTCELKIDGLGVAHQNTALSCARPRLWRAAF